eukprot:Blabericola_migrator_1__1566@NODE_1413_length_4600_cov_49_847121_g940_i0_p4_GENE_NODE_1413_length_4600_cov_49_847121_g940_i0NODE_1413_length_4600_cov_49_847121_g940_i0_p4_ORF_typecomplete_len117_score7_15Noelin1/PF12308_8/0_27_NODE_1413_length_4600_cov_49_847121_g940_i019812331
MTNSPTHLIRTRNLFLRCQAASLPLPFRGEGTKSSPTACFLSANLTHTDCLSILRFVGQSLPAFQVAAEGLRALRALFDTSYNSRCSCTWVAPPEQLQCSRLTALRCIPTQSPPLG